MGLFQSKISKEELEIALNKAKEIVSSNPVVVFRCAIPVYFDFGFLSF